ncbi:hypothetical protein [Dokdonia sp. R86516]|uniref:hypothetical protein n=1 Tax=Dokdonia sp. R86516 TaxID=3093856 RepID=UPI0037C5DF56
MKKTRKDNIITTLIENELKSNELKEKYLSLLISRIEENRKTMRRYSSLLILIMFSYYLIFSTTISEISIGPLKFKDNSIVILLLPSMFSFIYYRYIAVWIELADQKHVYSNTTSKLFNLDFNSLLNDRLRFNSLIETFIIQHLNEKSGFLSFIVNLLWVPIAYGLIISPFIFNIYSTVNIYRKFEMTTFFEWLLFLTPIVIGFFTLLVLIKTNRMDINRKKPA